MMKRMGVMVALAVAWSGAAQAEIMQRKPGEGQDPAKDVEPSWSVKYEHVAKGDIDALRGDPLPDSNTSTVTAAYELGYALTDKLKLAGGLSFSRAEDFDRAGDDASGVSVNVRLTSTEKIGFLRPFASYAGEAAFADSFGAYQYLDHTLGFGAELVSTNYYDCDKQGAANLNCRGKFDFKIIGAYSHVFSDDDLRDRGTPSLAVRLIGTAPARIKWIAEAKGELRRFKFRETPTSVRREDDRLTYALTLDFARTLMPEPEKVAGQPDPKEPWLQELGISVRRVENDSNVAGKDLHELQIVPTIKIGRRF